MHALVVYYSRTGNTRKVGEELARVLPGDVEELIDTVNRAGPLGFLSAAGDASQRKLTKLQPIMKDPSAYDLVLVGTPNWNANVSTPVRTYLAENRAKFKSVAFFCTQGVRGGSEKAFAEMEAVAGKKPKATLTVPMSALKNGNHADMLKKFAAEVNA
ncbi:flavodoxin family protein [Methanocella sp. MCL-LM]|uniref:flavodoxin family protein n=1 Tax=Methanocella sp. MCL-LM TaxID=3412035 RepID=UPI003C74852A